MADDSMPPANLILQALHGVRSDLPLLHEDLEQVHTRLGRVEVEVSGVKEEVSGVKEEVSGVKEEVVALGRRTTEGFLQTNTKLADLTLEVGKHDRRLDHLLTTGLGAEVRELKKRVTRLEPGRVVRRPLPRK